MYLGSFKNKSDIIQEFAISEEEVKDIKVLYASYQTGDWEGSAFVVFARKGKLYEVNASHCSCYGLEGQWDPEVTFVEALMHRVKIGWIEAVPDIAQFRGVIQRWSRKQRKLEA